MSNIKIYGPDNLTTELATITVASSCSRSEKINGENVLEFSIPIKHPASTHINEVNIIGIDGDFFDIAEFGKKQNGAGLRMADVECEHVSYRLNDPDYNLEYFTQTGTPTAVLAALLDGTGFTAGTVDFTDAVTYSAQEAKSRRALLMEFAAILGGELVFSAFSVSIRTQRGSSTPKALTVGRDVSVIGKQVNKRQRDAEGNPIIAYTCGVYNTDGLALGDVVTLSESGMAINATLRIVGLSRDPFNPRSSTVIEVGNSVKGIEDDLYRIETQTIVKDKVYNGTRIGPVNGFENILSDKKFRSYFNALGMAFQVGDGTGENWVNKLYLDIDSETGEAQLMFDGTLSANVINALKASIDVVISNTTIINNLTAQKGYIAELTVDQIDTSDMVKRYLLPSSDPLRLAPVGYWRGYDQYLEWLDAQIPDLENVEDVHVTDRNGELLYWLDEEHIGTGLTYDVTDYPVMRFVYNGPDGIGLTKLAIKHEYDTETGYYNPTEIWGAGNGVGNNGKCIVRKPSGGYEIVYYATGAGSVPAGTAVSFSLTDDGPQLPGYEKYIQITDTFPSTPYEGQKIIYTGGDAPKISYSNLKDLPSTFTPSMHGSSHAGGGTDAIPSVVSSGVSGLMTGADKAKLDGVAAGANNYTHPSSHPPSIIAQDASNRFVTDAEKAQWNAAEVNQNAFSNVAVSGQSTASASSKTDTLTLAAGAGITLTTSGKTVTVASTGSGGAAIDVAKAGTLIGTRGKINFIEGSNVTLSVVDDSANGRVNVTVAASGSGGSTAVDSDWGAL